MKSTILREFWRQKKKKKRKKVRCSRKYLKYRLSLFGLLFALYFSIITVVEGCKTGRASLLCSNDQDWFAFYFYADALMYLIYLLQYPAVLVHIEFLISDTARNNKKRCVKW